MEIDGINIIVQKKDMKTMRLRVKPSGEVILSAPKRAANAHIEQFARSNITWIRTKLAELSQRQSSVVLCEGGSVPFLGKSLILHINTGGRASVRIVGDELFLTIAGPTDPQVCEDIINRLLYKKALERLVPVIAQKYEKLLGIKAQSWSYRKMETRWGSCSTASGKIRINTRLAAFPAECIEYVVLHELCHLIVPNHSADFYALVERYMPSWKKHRGLLSAKSKNGDI